MSNYTSNAPTSPSTGKLILHRAPISIIYLPLPSHDANLQVWYEINLLNVCFTILRRIPRDTAALTVPVLNGTRHIVLAVSTVPFTILPIHPWGTG